MTTVIKEEHIDDTHAIELELECSYEVPVYVVAVIERYSNTDDIWHDIHRRSYKDEKAAKRAYSQYKCKLKKELVSL